MKILLRAKIHLHYKFPRLIQQNKQKIKENQENQENQNNKKNKKNKKCLR